MNATAISSNHFSVDQQVEDAMTWLRDFRPGHYQTILGDFPEWEDRVFNGSWLDTEAMGVDPDWSSWLIDAIEATGLVTWWEGEPWAGDPYAEFEEAI